MSVTVTLEEEELYLAALLDDPSGLDLAEFCWLDEEADDGCFRAWDYQWAWWRNDDPYQIDQAGRSLGKSVGITMRAFAFPFKAPGQEMLVTAPELNHLRPLTDQIEHRLTTTRLTRELLPAVKGMGIARQPHFQVRFTNNARIITRLPNKDGKGVKGSMAAGAIVLTRNGLKPIEDVVPGDEVLTHMNRWRRVLDNIRSDADVDLIDVAGGGNRSLVMSWNHRMFGRRNRNPQRTRRLSPINWVIADDPELGDRWYFGSPTTFPSEPLPATPVADIEALLALAGAYVADGNQGVNRIALTDDVDEVPRLLALAEAVGCTAHAYDKAVGSRARTVEIYGKAVANWLLEHFGQYAAGKRLPVWLLGAEERYRKAFLYTYLAGDGHWSPVKRRWELSTASKPLAVGLRLLGQSLGYQGSLSWTDPKPNQVSPAPQRSWRVQLTDHGHAQLLDGILWTKVRAATESGRGVVYSMVVEGDESYIADGLISHNQHPIHLEMDEAQDYPLAGWVELIETLKRGSKGFTWRCHGVSRGVRDKFYELTQESSGWTVHRLTAVHRPTWDDAERQAKIREYGGSRDNPDYKRNIFGEHGDATNPLFVLARLMAIVRQDAEYNDDIYACRKISYELVANAGTPIQTFLDLPGSHLAGYSGYYGGMDVGFTADPSEILVFGEQVKTGKLRLLTRIQLARVHAADQRRVITALFDFYGAKLRRFAMDKTGLGLPIWQDMLTEPISGANDRVIGYNFSGLYPVEVEDRPLKPGEKPADLVIKKNIKDWSSDQLRHWVDQRVLELPFDRELLSEWQGQSYSVAPQAGNPYGRRSYSAGSYHTLDAGRMFAAAKGLEAIEAMLAKPVATEGPVLDVFVGAGY